MPFHPEALAAYADAARDPAVVDAWCRDYRAAALPEGRRHALEAGHFLAEECPEEVGAALLAHLRAAHGRG